MSDLPVKRIRVDWDELEEAFVDRSSDHRYYLDRETGAVHFFSAYLDNDEESEDERALTAGERYVLIPYERRGVPREDLVAFVSSLSPPRERRVLEAALSEPEGQKRFQEKLSVLPTAKHEWEGFIESRLETRIKRWLEEVAVEPL